MSNSIVRVLLFFLVLFFVVPTSSWGVTMLEGTWEAVLHGNDLEIRTRIVFVKSNGVISGVMIEEETSEPLTNVIVDGDRVNFIRSVPAKSGAQKYTFAGVIVGDNLSGKFDSGIGEFDLVAEKLSDISDENISPLVGEWKFDYEINGRPQGVLVRFKESGGVLSCTTITQSGNVNSLEEVRIAGNRLVFSIRNEWGEFGQYKYTGTFTPGEIVGFIETQTGRVSTRGIRVALGICMHCSTHDPPHLAHSLKEAEELSKPDTNCDNWTVCLKFD